MVKACAANVEGVSAAECVFGLLLLFLGSVGTVGSVTASLTPLEDAPSDGFLGLLHRRAYTGGLPFALASLSTFGAGVLLVAVAC